MQVQVVLRCAVERKFPLEVDQSAPIATMKKKIYEQEGIPPELQRLVFARKQLDDECVLSDCGVEDGASFYLISHVRRVRAVPRWVVSFTLSHPRWACYSHRPSTRALSTSQRVLDELAEVLDRVAGQRGHIVLRQVGLVHRQDGHNEEEHDEHGLHAGDPQVAREPARLWRRGGVRGGAPGARRLLRNVRRRREHVPSRRCATLGPQ